MSFRRSMYGIEYDEQQNSSFRKLWVPVTLVLVVILPLLFFRGCGKADGAEEKAGEIGQTRYQVPEVETKRERPSIFRHFMNYKKTDTSAPESKAPDAPVRSDKTDVKAAPSPPPPAVVKMQSPEVKRLLEQVVQHESANDLISARQVLHQILLRKDAADVRDFCERKIGSINTALVFDDRPMPEKIKHRIASGDLIGKLSKRYGNTQAYLLKANGIDRPDRLRIGQELWVLQNPEFELTVQKKTSGAVLTLNGQFFKRYEIGLGQPPEADAGAYTVRSGVLVKLGLRNADAEELRVLLPQSTPVTVMD